ncbi:MAG: hypothetical protein EHM45_06120 [Desulfobacteraceae bacterium]|nr:MAG: hypothetical protein EHM45_06120 [Desulfobacteraceae bacterium]
MYKKFTVDLPRGWKVTFDRITDQPPFDKNGQRDYDVSEGLFQAELEQTEGKPLIVDIGFYQAVYKVYLVLADNWDKPIEVVSCDTAIDAVAIAKKLTSERT